MIVAVAGSKLERDQRALQGLAVLAAEGDFFFTKSKTAWISPCPSRLGTLRTMSSAVLRTAPNAAQMIASPEIGRSALNGVTVLQSDDAFRVT